MPPGEIPPAVFLFSEILPSYPLSRNSVGVTPSSRLKTEQK